MFFYQIISLFIAKDTMMPRPPYEGNLSAAWLSEKLRIFTDSSISFEVAHLLGQPVFFFLGQSLDVHYSYRKITYGYVLLI